MGFRTYLEQQLEEYERVEQERMEERQIATRKILERMKTDDAMRSFEGNPSASLQNYFRCLRYQGINRIVQEIQVK